MHPSNLRSKSDSSTVSTSKSKTITIAAAMSNSGASKSKHTSQTSATSKEQPSRITKSGKGSTTNSSSSAKPSQFYMHCKNNEIDAVTALLPTLTPEKINQVEPNGSTALHAAAYYGNQEIVKLLLSKGARKNIRNCYGSTPYEEAKTENIRKLFHCLDGPKIQSRNRFVSEGSVTYEWIFVESDPSSYALFNRQSLWKCSSDEEFFRLCRGIRQHYINENGPFAHESEMHEVRSLFDEAIKKNEFVV